MTAHDVTAVGDPVAAALVYARRRTVRSRCRAPRRSATLRATCWRRSTLRIPGIRFRMVDEQGSVRPHIKMFVGEVAHAIRRTRLPPDAEVMIVGALSGG